MEALYDGLVKWLRDNGYVKQPHDNCWWDKQVSEWKYYSVCISLEGTAYISLGANHIRVRDEFPGDPLVIRTFEGMVVRSEVEFKYLMQNSIYLTENFGDILSLEPIR